MSSNDLTRRILVPLDGSDLGACTYPHLRALACVESQILLLGVVNDPLPMLDPPLGSGYEAARRREIDDSRAHLRAVAQALRDVTPHITVMVTPGAPADEILRIADEREVDLIVMPTHGRGALGQLVPGSVSNRVVQASPIPVMLLSDNDPAASVGTDACALCRRVLVPLDGSERTRCALPVAVAFARTLNATVHLLRAVPTQDELFAARGRAAESTPGQAPTGAATPRARGRAARYEDYCAALAEALDEEAARLRRAGVCASSELLLGKPVPSILSVAGPGDIIVLASHGTGGVRHWPMGSVAEQLVAAAATPVVLVPVAERRRLGVRGDIPVVGSGAKLAGSVARGLGPERHLVSRASVRR